MTFTSGETTAVYYATANFLAAEIHLSFAVTYLAFAADAL